MDDKKDSQTNDKQMKERNANTARISWEDRIRRDVKELLEAYNGNYSEVLEAYRHAQQAATRRCKQLWRQAILAKHDEKLAKCELQLATAIIDEMFIQAVKASCTDERATTPNNRAANEPPAVSGKSEDSRPQ